MVKKVRERAFSSLRDNKIKIGIIGGSGYTGIELIRILSRHKEIDLSVVTSEKYAGEEISSVFPSFKGIISKRFEKLSLPKIASECDLIFTALPHKESQGVVSYIIASGKKVIDLSADFRISDPSIYEHWYKSKHENPDLLKYAVYGIPELNREKIKSANLVANPGCYPTSVILALIPVLKNKLIDISSIIIDSKSGVSGGGRGAATNFMYCECAESVKAYSVTSHRHTPEIEQELGKLSNEDIKVSFTPHLIPMSRGILSTIYCRLKDNSSEDDIRDLYENFYKEENFIRIVAKDGIIQTSSVVGSNYCDLSIYVDKRNNRLILISAIDNLIKGASGQAVQNMNIMYSIKENTALDHTPFYPL